MRRTEFWKSDSKMKWKLSLICYRKNDKLCYSGLKLDLKFRERKAIKFFSATQTKKTEDLARISLKKMPVYIGVDDLKDTATNEQLEQGYIVAESDVRLRILYTFLKKNKSKKIMVFFSSCMSVKFHYEVCMITACENWKLLLWSACLCTKKFRCSVIF